MGVLCTEHAHLLKLSHQLMINIRFLFLIANGDGLRTVVIPMRDKVANCIWYKERREIKGKVAANQTRASDL